ncbi:MAG TPA: LysM peptidoglycan-binding domain-containing protein [Candidatus Dojkabacteria bacterium]|nr:LysM peptidoglycan-binding domain-containing protein [Candidatus Dojkabacteria bacterium]
MALKEKSEDSLQKIQGFSFKDVVNTFEDESENLYQDSSVFVDDDRNFFSKFKGGIFDYIKTLINYLAKRENPVGFFIQLLHYFAVRFRIIFVFISVIGSVIEDIFEDYRKILVKKMFWGRSSLFRFAYQLVGVGLVVMIFLSYSYNSSPIFSNANLALAASNQDLLAQKSVTTIGTLDNVAKYESSVHVVKPGDTLTSIASAEGISVATLMWANDLTAADFIRPGDKLVIPPGNGVLVTVKKGDTIFSLGKKYKTDPQLILTVNVQYATPEDIHVGDSLFIPDAIAITPPVSSKPVYSGVVASAGGSTSYGYNSGVATATRFLRWPVAGGGSDVTQCFSPWHNGMDVADSSYPNLVAAASGVVSFAGCQSGYCPAPGVLRGGYGLAWAVAIDHGNGWATVYGHMSGIYVHSGEHVSSGQIIGRMGQTGSASGVHVHFMVVRSGTWTGVNPAPFFVSGTFAQHPGFDCY